jgi:hypothetical protein
VASLVKREAAREWMVWGEAPPGAAIVFVCPETAHARTKHRPHLEKAGRAGQGLISDRYQGAVDVDGDLKRGDGRERREGDAAAQTPMQRRPTLGGGSGGGGGLLTAAAWGGAVVHQYATNMHPWMLWRPGYPYECTDASGRGLAICSAGARPYFG